MIRFRVRKTTIACAIALGGNSTVLAQSVSNNSVIPGVYTQTIEHTIVLEKDGGELELSEGQSGFADNQQLTQLKEIPEFLSDDWIPPPAGLTSFRGCGAFSGENALTSANQPLQSDFQRFDRKVLNQIDSFVQSGYPPASVLMHAVSMGIPMERALYAAVQSAPVRADELYRVATELMSFLPGWVCSANLNDEQYNPVYDINDLPSQRRIRDVADRYFDDKAMLARFPDWPKKEFHMLASIDELIDLVEREDIEYWYRPGPVQSETPGGNPRDSVLIALYLKGQKVVIDTSMQQLQSWKQEGRDRVPVTFFYNFKYQRPISQFGNDVSLQDIENVFFDDGIELTPVPLWTVGDHHLQVTADELEELFDIPEKQEIDPDHYQLLLDELNKNGFSKKPVLVTLLRSGRYKRLSQPDRIRVAMDQGYSEFPTTLFYHRLERQACGAPAICFDQLCGAVACGVLNGSGSTTGSGFEFIPQVCQPAAVQVGLVPGGGGTPPPPIIPPPPPPPMVTPPPPPPPPASTN